MSRKTKFNRRRFLKVTGLATGATAFSAVLQGCAEPAKTSTPVNPSPSASPLTLTATTAASPTARPVLVSNPPDSYLALAPGSLTSGQTGKLSVTLFNGVNLASSPVQFDLLQGSQSLATVTGMVQGRGELELALPKLTAGDYQLQFRAGTLQAQTAVKVEPVPVLLFIESDKPIYKPGQTVHLRVLTLDNQLKPLTQTVTIEVSEAKGSKIFKKEVQTDMYGMGLTDLPLSTEPNLGIWRVLASSGSGRGQTRSQLDLRVERYVLPKYEIKLDMAKEWVQVGEKIKGTIKAEYSYGKPVMGEVQLKATKYVGSWQEFATINYNLDGSINFELPAPGYVAGVPANGGQGNVSLEITVKEKATGYEEKTTRLLTVVTTPLTLKIIPENLIFKPGLPLSLLIVAQTPDKNPADSNVTVSIQYSIPNKGFDSQTRQVAVTQGLGMLKITPPAEAASLTIAAYSAASSDRAYTSLAMTAGYSPSGSFISLQQQSQGTLKVGDKATFKVLATSQAITNFYYEVTTRGRLIFSGVANSPEIGFTLTPEMAPNGRLVVYQLLPNAEVAADYLPFNVEANYPQKITASFDKSEVEPGQAVELSVQTDGPSRVGLAVVDRSVFILAENRLNLQQVFNELEKLYQTPQIELHRESNSFTPEVKTFSSKEVFGSAGLVVMSNKTVPEGKTFPQPVMMAAAGATTAAATTAAATTAAAAGGGLAEPARVRQFFPETWVWDSLISDATGKASKKLQAPDSITTWMLNAVALSPKTGLGIAQAQLKVLQPFFVQLDLVYSAIRGEQFPVKIALYNYTAQAEEFTVELEQANWFELQDPDNKRTVKVGPNDVGGTAFTITPRELGTRQLKVTARSTNRADAIIKDLLIEPEGVARELVENKVLSAGKSYEMELAIPAGIIGGSARAFLSLTGNYLSQTIEGLENLLRMPYGCGEQNMILFAPNVYVAQYLKETGQSKPDLQAKAESLMLTGYQRELTYRRNDGSFSAFGNSDKEGSLWLSAFVLKTLAQARGLIYIDETVLLNTRQWILSKQKSDGSFEPVGFLHHQDLLGGLKGNIALSAYVAGALLEAGETNGANRTIGYLESKLASLQDSYSLALSAYILALAKSGLAKEAYDRLLNLAQSGEEGLYWSEGGSASSSANTPANSKMQGSQPNPSAAIETTGYGLLALLANGNLLKASQVARWLVSQRNALGGFSSTQDTVVGLQALTRFVTGSKTDVDATISLRNGTGWQKELTISPTNADVVQIMDVPFGEPFQVEMRGKGQAILQSVRRFNVPDPDRPSVSAFQIKVDYGANEIAVNNQITVTADVQFTPPEQLQAGMVVLDVALPTGFAAVTESLDTLAKQQAKLKRYDLAGRKVLLYIEDMAPGEKLKLEFKAVALYPIKAQPVTSQAYSYYRPEWKGENLGGAVTVKA